MGLASRIFRVVQVLFAVGYAGRLLLEAVPVYKTPASLPMFPAERPS